MSASGYATDEMDTQPCERVDRVGKYFKRLFERSLEFEFATRLRVDLDKLEGTRCEPADAAEVLLAPRNAGADTLAARPPSGRDKPMNERPR